MQVVDSAAEFQQHFSACVLTIGKYDGLHLGHQEILAELKQEAARLGLPSVVLLSEPQPEEFFRGVDAPPRLTHFNDKVELLASMGIDAVFRLKFDQATSQMSAEDFVTGILVEGLGVKSIVVGHDFAFGKNRTGNIEFLHSHGKKYDFTVKDIDPFNLGAERISSTLVRKLLQQGDCAGVTKILGRNYSISGEVIEGRKLGRELGFPTANIQLSSSHLPLSGVFAVRAQHNGKIYRGVANAGCRPTVDTTKKAHLEVFLFCFNDDIYGQHLNINFMNKIRDEIKFSSVDALKDQIAKDVSQAKAYFWKEEVNVV